jgi:hypothetical protein
MFHVYILTGVNIMLFLVTKILLCKFPIGRNINYWLTSSYSNWNGLSAFIPYL